MSGKLIAVFVSTHETLRAEKAFKKARIKVRSTVKPRHISASCQLAITFPEEKLSDIKRVVKEMSLELTHFFRQDENGDWAEAK